MDKDQFEWEPRELPDMGPTPKTGSARRRRSGSAEFDPQQLAFLNTLLDTGVADRRIRQREHKTRSNLAGLQQAVQPQMPQVPQVPQNAQAIQRGAPERPRAATPRRPPSKFRSLYTGATLKQLTKDTDRGSLIGLGKGLGKFEGVIKSAAKLAASGAADEAAACAHLVKELQGYLTEERDKEYEAEKAKGNKGDAITIKKHETAVAMRLEARRMQEDAIDARHPDRNGDHPARRLAAMPAHAAEMAQTFGAGRASGGTSDVRLVRDSAGKVAYAFKSIAGESDQTFLPKGGAAVREAMCSFVAEAIKQQTQGLLDFGAPAATIATLPDEQGAAKMGALVEGINGRMADPEGIAKDYADGNQSALELATYKADMKASQELSRRVPPRELNKVLLCNLATANYDIKWGNMICVEGSDGQVTARPFDGGAAFPTDKAVAAKGLDTGGVNAGGALLIEAISGVEVPKPLPQADVAMDPELVLGFMKIDADALEQAILTERARLSQAHGLSEDLLDDASIQRAIKSIRAVQSIFMGSPDLTMAEFVAAYDQLLVQIVA